MEGVTTLNQYIISNWVLEYRNTSKSKTTQTVSQVIDGPDLQVI